MYQMIKPMTEVCLVSPLSHSFNHFRPPLALMYLAAYLEKKKIHSAIAEVILSDQISRDNANKNREGKNTELLNKILATKARFIGISCYTPDFNEVIELARQIKKISPDKIIIVGGVHPTLYPKDFFFPGSPVDFAVMGEGEITLYELITILKKNRAQSKKILGITYRSKTNKIITTPMRPLIKNLDSLPFPAWDKVDMGYYTRPNPYGIRGIYLSTFYILTSRGCPSRCTFCVSRKLRECYPGQLYIRSRSAKNIYEEVKLLKEKYGIDGFYIIDDFFITFKQNAMNFCRLLLSKKIRIWWGCETKVTALSEEIMDYFSKSGCKQIDFGVESGSQKMLDRIKKDITVELTETAFSLCHRYNIRTFANILINLPGETKKDLQLTLKLIDKINPTVVSFNIFTPYLGTEIYESLKIKFHPDQYYLLSKPPAWLIKTQPHLFRFALHHLNIASFANVNQRKYNRTSQFLKAHLCPGYLSLLLHSRKRKDYFYNTVALFKEYFQQKK